MNTDCSAICCKSTTVPCAGVYVVVVIVLCRVCAVTGTTVHGTVVLVRRVLFRLLLWRVPFTAVLFQFSVHCGVSVTFQNKTSCVWACGCFFCLTVNCAGLVERRMMLCVSLPVSVQGIRDTRTLVSLNLRGNSFGHDSDCVAALNEGISSNESLRVSAVIFIVSSTPIHSISPFSSLFPPAAPRYVDRSWIFL